MKKFIVIIPLIATSACATDLEKNMRLLKGTIETLLDKLPRRIEGEAPPTLAIETLNKIFKFAKKEADLAKADYEKFLAEQKRLAEELKEDIQRAAPHYQEMYRDELRKVNEMVDEIEAFISYHFKD